MTKPKSTIIIALFAVVLLMLSNVSFAADTTDTTENDLPLTTGADQIVAGEETTPNAPDDPADDIPTSNLGVSYDGTPPEITSASSGSVGTGTKTTKSAGVMSASVMSASTSSGSGGSVAPQPADSRAAVEKSVKVSNYQTNLFTGSASYSYAIEVPPGVNSLQPQVYLSYNHYQAASKGELGQGWSIGTSFISRDINNTRSNQSDDIFYLNLNGASSKLVYVASENAYHTEVETYVSIKKDATGWIVKTKDGTTYKFGYSTVSRLESTLESYTSVWYLTEVQDTYGNKIGYEYLVNPSPDQAMYLSRIYYSVNEIKFNYNLNSQNWFNGYAYGTKLKKTALLDSIEVKNSNTLARKYKFDYSTIDNKKFLSKIRLIGSDVTSELPPVTFSYYQNSKGWSSSTGWIVPETAYFGDAKDQGVRLIDVNGDGLNDLIKSTESGSTVWYNNGAGFGTAQTLSNFISGGLVDSYNRDKGVRFIDINTDTRVDALQSVSGQINAQQLKVNTGSGFVNSTPSLPSGVSFTELVAPSTCTPSSCSSGDTDNGLSCSSSLCTRTCLSIYYTCGTSWSQVFDNSGSGYDSDWVENDDLTRAFYAPSDTKCYKYYVNTPNYVDITVDDNNCDPKYTNDGDSVFIAGLRSMDSEDSWLSTVPPLSTYEGWYGAFDGDYSESDFYYSYLTSHEWSDDDFDSTDSSNFESDDNYIYCAPSYETCYHSNLNKPCGYGCAYQNTRAFVQSGYYLDVGNWLETIAYDNECHEAYVSENDAEYIRLKVYEANTDAHTSTYQNACAITPPSNKDLGVRVADINGDGKSDLIKGTAAERKTWLRTDSGWVEDLNWQVPSSAYFTDSSGNDMGVRIADVNGDGMPDLVRGYGTINTIWINTGKGWIADSAWQLPSGVSFVSSSQSTGTMLVDVDGDGLTDIVQSDGTTRNTWINTGAGWVQDSSWAVPSGVNLKDYSASLDDVNGDGAIDIVNAPNSGTRQTMLNNYQKQYLIKEIKNSLGGSTAVDYKKITSLDNTGNDSVSDLGFAGWVVSTITNSNGMSGNNAIQSTTSYDYADGLFDTDDREFRGFNSVTETLPDGSKVKHWFYQDDGRKGIEYKSEIFDNSNTLYTGAENLISSGKVNGYYITALISAKNYLFDGTAANPKVTQTKYDYDNYGNIVKTSYLGDVSVSGDEKYDYTEFAYNTDAWIMNAPKHTYLLGPDDQTKSRETFYSYDSQSYGQAPTKGDATKEESWLNSGQNPVTTYAYDTYGNLISKTDPNSYTTSYLYDSTHTYPTKETNALGQETNYLYDLGTGNLLSATDTNGQKTEYAYDVFGREIREIQPYDSASYPTVAYQYNFDGTAPEEIKVMQRETAGGSATLDNYVYYDGLGDVLQTKRESEGSQMIANDAFYNSMNRLSKESNPYYAAAGYTAPSTIVKGTSYTYDTLGRVTSTTNPDSTKETTVYDHWTESVYDENNHRKDYVKDASGNIIAVNEYNNGDKYTTEYEYSTADDLLKITDSNGNDIAYTYDSLGRKTRLDDSDLGVWHYSYDSAGNIISQSDNKGNTITMQYDKLGRLITKTSSGGAINYYYDIDKKGTLTRVETPSVTIKYTYDNKLRTIKEERIIDGITFTTAFTYDSADRLVSKKLPDRTTVAYTYNTQGEIDSVSDFVTNIDYNEAGKPVKRVYKNALQTDITYDLLFRPTRIKTGALQDLNYAFDAVGNVLGISENVDKLAEKFTYDNLDRLIYADKKNSTVNMYNITYSYDSIGNMLKMMSSLGFMTFNYGSGPVHAPISVNTNMGITAKNIIECTADSQCSANQACVSGWCRNVTCRSDSECGSGSYTGNSYCKSNDIFRKYINYACKNPGTAESRCYDTTDEKLQKTCSQSEQCVDGQCIAITCYFDSDCGNNGQLSKKCDGNNVINTYRSWTCVNAGTSSSRCESNDEKQVINECSSGCSNGNCNQVDLCAGVTCASHCEGFTWFGEPQCKNGQCAYTYVESNSKKCNFDYCANVSCTDGCDGYTWKSGGQCVAGSCVYDFIEHNSQECGYKRPDGNTCSSANVCAGGYCVNARCASTSCPVIYRTESTGVEYPNGNWIAVIAAPAEPYTSGWREVYDPDGTNCPSLNKPGSRYCTVDSECESKKCTGNKCEYVTPPAPSKSTTDLTVSGLFVAVKTPAVGIKTVFRFTILNAGSDYLENIYWKLQTGETDVFNTIPIKLYGGQQADVYTNYNYTYKGNYSLKVIVDPNNNVSEFNENNNEAIGKITVR